MDNEIISYLEMCQREGASLQHGMNYQLGANHSVILMSLCPFSQMPRIETKLKTMGKPSSTESGSDHDFRVRDHARNARVRAQF